MLKTLLAAGVVCAGVSAQAQNLSFDTNVSFEMTSALFKSAEADTIAAQTQFDVGAFALQADFLSSATYNAELFREPDLRYVSAENAILGAHAAYKVSDSVRVGGFASYAFAPRNVFGGILSVGAEAMLSFGRTDIEAAADVTIFSGYQMSQIYLAAYHMVNPQLEFSVEATTYISGGRPDARIVMASAHAKYTLPNAPLSLKVGFQNAYLTWHETLPSVRVGISYEFGTPSRYRAFSRRGFDYSVLTVAARP
ncbi:MAG TPA: hypothetical protein EYG79_06785 [Rhodobacteraceae bacterium]|nr:hypothetical protein [Paracoccaceae bacterium]